MDYHPYRHFHCSWFWYDPEGWWSGRCLFYDGTRTPDVLPGRHRAAGHTHTIYLRLHVRDEETGELNLEMTNCGDVNPQALEHMCDLIRTNYDDTDKLAAMTQNSISAGDSFLVHQLIRLKFIIAMANNRDARSPAATALISDCDQLEAQLYDRVPELQGAINF